MILKVTTVIVKGQRLTIPICPGILLYRAGTLPVAPWNADFAQFDGLRTVSVLARFRSRS